MFRRSSRWTDPSVFPIAEAVADEYQRVDPTARVTVGVSGTGGGFKIFSRARQTSPMHPDRSRQSGSSSSSYLSPATGLPSLFTPTTIGSMFCHRMTLSGCGNRRRKGRSPVGVRSEPSGRTASYICLDQVWIQARSITSPKQSWVMKGPVAEISPQARTTTYWYRGC